MIGSPSGLPLPDNISYTRTGRISKAKKGLKVYNCECGRSYTRAEHLRRHRKNHAQDDALVCDFPDCGKVFYRLDLLQRHQERHLESRESASNAQLRSVVPADIPSGNANYTHPQSSFDVQSDQNIEFNNLTLSNIGYASSTPDSGYGSVYTQFSGDASSSSGFVPYPTLLCDTSYAPLLCDTSYPPYTFGTSQYTASYNCRSSVSPVQPPSEEYSWGLLEAANLTSSITQGSVIQSTNVKTIEKGKAPYMKEEELPPNKVVTSKASIIEDSKALKQELDELSDVKVKKEEEDQEHSLHMSTASYEPSRSSYIVKRRASSKSEQILRDQPPVRCNEPLVGSQQTGSRLLDINPSPQHSTEGGLQDISGDSPAGWSCDSEQWTEGSISETESPRQVSIDSASVSKVADFLFIHFQIWKEFQGFHCRGQTSNDTSINRNSVTYDGTNNSASYSGAVTSSQQTTTTQKRIPDDDDDEHRSSKRRKFEDAADDSDNRLLACPFAKNSPLAHRRCFRYVLQDIGRLKQHLLRVHRIPIHCPRCSKTFDGESERDAHLREQSQCIIGPRRTWEGISEQQRRVLSKRVSAKRTKEENWYFIFVTLFPNSPRPESPYVESAQLSEELVALREFVIAEAPGHVAQFATSSLLPRLRPDQEDIEAFTRAAVREVFDRVLERWEASASSQANLTDRVWPTESGTSQDSTYSSQNRSLSSNQSGSISQGGELYPSPQIANMHPLNLQAPPSNHLVAARSQNEISNLDIEPRGLVGPSVGLEEALYDFPSFDPTPFNWEDFGA